jgi:hypothetical protein
MEIKANMRSKGKSATVRGWKSRQAGGGRSWERVKIGERTGIYNKKPSGKSPRETID